MSCSSGNPSPRPHDCVERLVEILAHCHLLHALADRGEEGCEKDECLVVFGAVRDAVRELRTAVDARLAQLGCGSCAAWPAAEPTPKERRR